MLLIDSLAEERIQIAIRYGELDNLPGCGAPLALDDDTAVPVELRVGYRMLKNSGYLPEDLSLRKEIHEVEMLLHQAELEAEAQTIRRRLNLLKTRLAFAGNEGNLLAKESAYREKLIHKLFNS